MGGTTSLVFNFLKGRDTVSSHMDTIGNRAQGMAARLKAASSMTSIVMGALISIIAGLISEIVAFISATAPMAGALAALPALAFAAVAGIAALVIGFHGLSGAMKKYSESAGQSAETVASNEHRLITAQRAATQAQIDLNEARRMAALNLATMSRELARAHLDERGAILAVKDAQLALRQAQGSGDKLAVEHAKLGYDESVQSLQEVQARLTEVAYQQQKTTTAGVEGSVEVKTALQHQADAVYELAQAQRTLAMGGVSGQTAAAYARLSAQGKALVDTLHQLSGAWRGVQQATQGAMLDKVAADLRRMSGVYLPVMRTQLPALAQGWNNLLRSVSRTATTAGFVNDMNVSLGRSATLWQRVGDAFGPFLSGFQHWVVIGSSFLPRLGSWTQKQAATFDQWSASMRESGKGAAWIERALSTGHDFWVLLKNLTGATVALFSAGSAGPNYLKNLSDGAAALRDFLSSDAGKSQAAHLFSQLRDIWSAAWAAFKQLLDALSKADLSGVIGAFTVAGAAFAYLADHMDTVNKLLPVLIPAFVAFKFAILGAQAGLAVAQVAMTAWKIAVGIATAVQWLWNAAMYANPIGLIILAIVALVAIIIVAIKYHKQIGHFFVWIWGIIWDKLKQFWAWLRDVFGPAALDAITGPYQLAWKIIKWTWDQIVKAASTAADWVVTKWNALVDFVSGLGGRLAKGAAGIWDWLKDSLKDSINWVIGNINWLIGKFNWLTSQWSKLGADVGINLPTFTAPQIPALAGGGDVRRSGLAMIHIGERVVPAAQVSSLPSGGGRHDVVELRAGDAFGKLVMETLRKAVRNRGGDVQFVLGNG